MVRVLTTVFFLLYGGLQVGSLGAQLRGYGAGAGAPAAREPARVGLLGGLREAREDRFRREAQVDAAAARAEVARAEAARLSAARGATVSPGARNPGVNPNVNPYANPNTNVARSGAVANNNMLRRDPVTGATLPSALSAAANQRSIEAARAANVARSANYGGVGMQNPNASKSLLNNANYDNANRPSTFVAPASASSFVPAPRRDERIYNGPGVAIRLPEDARGVVNYLVDDAENNTVRPGEQQVLDANDSFVIRYSRGVTADGRSFGESRYTVSEGSYRFELTDSGWELYRESEGGGQLAPPNRIDLAESNLLPSRSAQEQRGPLMDRPYDGFSSTKPMVAGSRELPTESLATERLESSVVESSAAVPTPSAEAAEVVNAEELPAPRPRSILEK